ncbi:uncharacterized protein PGTG_04664 [Puccinia graminis f. sp. tritici CRL 75-36-700-3]|uniref:Ecp2 effector protein domain-containing protein n=1 Tax=Puccinia graminis f. sp. tritici (strain CRL 75-36-700-3 / race SCCL) TaxID=418459 RepID=E3K3Q6_PUCGT|nr:uncharacterized protein PGTG_04664 [Puccinia graminis f. sp. tritici CRL 75-36-700-3]EFP78708.2 hypothetical protein PGTG_04664 [Puccinia graminis f. sp. tritici CRL 75-36-700-3]
MRTHRFFFIAVLGLVPGPSSQQISVITPKCDKNANVKFNPENCKTALKRVLYEPGNILDRVETHVERASGSCVVRPLIGSTSFNESSSTSNVFNQLPRVDNDNDDWPSSTDSIQLEGTDWQSPLIFSSKDSFELSINKILTQCKDTAGSISHPTISGVTFQVRPRGKDPVYEEDFPAEKPACYGVADARKSAAGLKVDCNVAYGAIFSYNDRSFSLDGYNPTNVARKGVGICQVQVFTSDGSIIKASIQQLDPIFKKMTAKCDTRNVMSVWCDHLPYRGNRKEWKSIP